MKKRILGALALVGLVGVSLTSCNSAKVVGDFTVPETFDKDAEVTVTFWNTMGDNLQSVLNEAIEGFNEYFPKVTVDSKQIGSYDDVKSQITTEFNTGNFPSMAYCYDDHVAAYNKASITVPLNDLMTNSKYGFGGSEVPYAIEQTDIIEGFRTKSDTFGDGNYYTVPFLRSTEVLYYNETFFTENNLTVPTTWEDLWTTCAQIKQIAPKSTPLGYDSESNFFITMCEAYGYDYTTATADTLEGHFLFNNDNTNAFISQLRDYYDKGYFTTQTLYNAYTSGLFTSGTEQTCYMCIGSSAGASYQFSEAFTANIAALPGTKAGKKAAISQGPSLVFFNNGNDQEVLAAWLFAQYLLTAEVQAQFALVSGYMPVTTPATQVKAYSDTLEKAGTDSKTNFATLSIKTALAQKDSYFTSPVFVGSAEARNQVGSLMASVMADSTITADNKAAKIKAAFDAAVKQCVYLVS